MEKENKTMTNEEKAREFANYFAGETDYKESAAYSSAMAMAKWKEQKMMKKFIDVLHKYTNLDNWQYDKIKQVMEE